MKEVINMKKFIVEETEIKNGNLINSWVKGEFKTKEKADKFAKQFKTFNIAEQEDDDVNTYEIVDGKTE